MPENGRHPRLMDAHERRKVRRAKLEVASRFVGSTALRGPEARFTYSRLSEKFSVRWETLRRLNRAVVHLFISRLVACWLRIRAGCLSAPACSSVAAS